MLPRRDGAAAGGHDHAGRHDRAELPASVHLLQNVVLAEWAPALAVLGIPPALARARPARAGCCRRSRSWVVNYARLAPAVALRRRSAPPASLLHLEHALYFGTGVLLWWPVVHGSHPPGAKAAYLFAAFVLASPIGLAARARARADLRLLRRRAGLWGLSALTDQQIAGVTMAVEQAIVFFAAFAFFFARFFAEQDAATG